jgi:hypothetical protein
MLFLMLAAVSAVIASPEVFAGDKQHGPGVTDAEIRIGNTMPYSGPSRKL